ncbi:MAG: adenosine deaminase, partial [Anaerolineae bacterium]|nr:adenosine deaminase [Anaerolineae bacterium]
MIDPSFPLVELHRHLDGSVRLQTILELGLAHDLPLPACDLEGLRPHVQVTDPQPGVVAFLRRFEWMTGVLVDLDACRRVAYENVEDARNEGIDYIELRFSPWFMAERHGLDPAGVTEAVVDGVRAGVRDSGTRANLIGILSRTYGPETAHRELRALLTQRDAITALDLAGDEANWAVDLFTAHFRIARNAGWHITVHAGEIAGPRSVWQALDLLGAERIGHGIRAIEDPALVDHLLAHRIPLEENLTSNLQTSCVPDYASHPARAFMEKGL